MIRRPPRSTQSRSSAASDVYKRQEFLWQRFWSPAPLQNRLWDSAASNPSSFRRWRNGNTNGPVGMRSRLAQGKAGQQAKAQFAGFALFAESLRSLLDL